MLVTSRICLAVDSVDPRHLAMSSLQSLMVILHGCCTPLYCTRLYCVLCTVPRESGEQCPYIVQVLLVLTWRKLGPGWAGPGWAAAGRSIWVSPHAYWRHQPSAATSQCGDQTVLPTTELLQQFNPSKPAKYGGEIVSSEHV